MRKENDQSEYQISLLSVTNMLLTWLKIALFHKLEYCYELVPATKPSFKATFLSNFPSKPLIIAAGKFCNQKLGSKIKSKDEQLEDQINEA